jgi:thymidine phosphorylase
LRLAGRIIEFDPDVRGGHGYAIAREILESGRALEKMRRIIKAQGAQDKEFGLGALSFDVLADEGGMVVAIDNLHLARVARLAGAPISKGAGVDLLRKLGDTVDRGEVLYRVYAAYPANLGFARDLTTRRSGFLMGENERVPGYFVDY